MARMIMMVLCVVVTSMVVSAPYAEAVLTCARVNADLASCIRYLTNVVNNVPPACCRGIVRLNNLAVSTTDRQATCNCIKNAASSISGINLDLAAGLPGMCGVNHPFVISPNIDCAEVQ